MRGGEPAHRPVSPRGRPAPRQHWRAALARGAIRMLQRRSGSHPYSTRALRRTIELENVSQIHRGRSRNRLAIKVKLIPIAEMYHPHANDPIRLRSPSEGYCACARIPGSQIRKRIKPTRTTPPPIPAKRRETARTAISASAAPNINMI